MRAFGVFGGSTAFARSAPPAADRPVAVAGVTFVPLREGALWWAAERMLVVADLHLEKSAAFARRGHLLPPYDTGATLARLGRLIRWCEPRIVVTLGDSFHDIRADEAMSDTDRRTLTELQLGRDWIWIAGNHDPELPASLEGQRATELVVGPVRFVHAPKAGPAPGEIAGHLHPAARVLGRNGSVRRRCFVGDGSRLVMPALGALAGGLNVLARPFRGLFQSDWTVHVLGADAVYAVGGARLGGD